MDESMFSLSFDAALRPVMMKLRRVRWARHVGLVGKMHTKFWSENLKGRDLLKYLGMGGKIIIEWILGK
jgi:hypothetical protein